MPIMLHFCDSAYFGLSHSPSHLLVSERCQCFPPLKQAFHFESRSNILSYCGDMKTKTDEGQSMCNVDANKRCYTEPLKSNTNF